MFTSVAGRRYDVTPRMHACAALINDLFHVWDVDDLVLPTCAPRVLDGQCLILEVGPYRTSRFQSWSGVKVNIIAVNMD